MGIHRLDHAVLNAGGVMQLDLAADLSRFGRDARSGLGISRPATV
jgi:hypothetical protein